MRSEGTLNPLIHKYENIYFGSDRNSQSRNSATSCTSHKNGSLTLARGFNNDRADSWRQGTRGFDEDSGNLMEADPWQGFPMTAPIQHYRAFGYMQSLNREGLTLTRDLNDDRADSGH